MRAKCQKLLYSHLNTSYWNYLIKWKRQKWQPNHKSGSKLTEFQKPHQNQGVRKGHKRCTIKNTTGFRVTIDSNRMGKTRIEEHQAAAAKFLQVIPYPSQEKNMWSRSSKGSQKKKNHSPQNTKPHLTCCISLARFCYFIPTSP